MFRPNYDFKQVFLRGYLGLTSLLMFVFLILFVIFRDFQLLYPFLLLPLNIPLFYVFKKGCLSLEEFFNLWESLGFKFLKRKSSFTAKKGNIYLDGFLYSTNPLGFVDLQESCLTNIKFFFLKPRSSLIVNHYLQKNKDKIKSGRSYYHSPRTSTKEGEEELSKLTSNILKGIDFLDIGRIVTSPEVVSIQMGPPDLVYKRYMKKNFPNVVLFTERLQKVLNSHPMEEKESFFSLSIENQIKVMEKQLSLQHQPNWKGKLAKEIPSLEEIAKNIGR